MSCKLPLIAQKDRDDFAILVASFEVPMTAKCRVLHKRNVRERNYVGNHCNVYRVSSPNKWDAHSKRERKSENVFCECLRNCSGCLDMRSPCIPVTAAEKLPLNRDKDFRPCTTALVGQQSSQSAITAVTDPRLDRESRTAALRPRPRRQTALDNRSISIQHEDKDAEDAPVQPDKSRSESYVSYVWLFTPRTPRARHTCLGHAPVALGYLLYLSRMALVYLINSTVSQDNIFLPSTPCTKQLTLTPHAHLFAKKFIFWPRIEIGANSYT
ncbi:hypothetical protein J6590_008423 [Homalodisca vitripennis]|nr:hypothetical protein J6590_008423 [Homalodisca vitripennis]